MTNFKFIFGRLVLFNIISLFVLSCNPNPPDSQKSSTTDNNSIDISVEDMDRLGITNKDYLSAASKRALNWPKDLGNEWFAEFRVQDLKGDLAYEEGVVRRDPSAIIQENGKYYVWYTKSVGPTQGFGGDIE